MRNRVVYAILLMAILFSCILASEVTRIMIFAVAGCICVYEYSSRLKENGINLSVWVLYGYLLVQFVLAVTHCGFMAYIAWYIVAIIFTFFSGIVSPKIGGKGAIYTASALSYPCFTFSLSMIVSTSAKVWPTFALAFIPCIICDIFALFGGTLIGKHKLCPSVSPNKTIEGSITGALFATLSGVGVYFILKYFPAESPSNIPLYVCLLAALISSTAGQIGDLTESLIKRTIGVKDFSNLIPGHGGMFDRCDSLMFAIPTAYLILYFFGY